MRVYTREEFELRKPELLEKIRNGALFIYPTDTIYGIGCDATNPGAVANVRKLKGNFKRPFSVIAPDKEWIRANCEIIGAEEEWIEKLPGPYTLILNLKNPGCVAGSVHQGDTLGVRIPDHWCTEIVRDAKVPIVTTSANLAGGLFMTSIEDLHESIRRGADFMIDAGPIQGRPSTIVHLYEDEPRVVKR